MKIICIGKNYKSHINEMGSKMQQEPLFFFKPDTAILQRNRPFFIPEFANQFDYEIELVYKISKVGKNINEKFANTYYSEIGLGVDFTARDLQQQCIKNGNPWEICKSFDNSAAISKFIPLENIINKENINFKLYKNNQIVQEGNSKDMVFSIDKIISYISQFITLKLGDIIFTGTPSGIGKISINDRLEGWIEEKKMFEFDIK